MLNNQMKPILTFLLYSFTLIYKYRIYYQKCAFCYTFYMINNLLSICMLSLEELIYSQRSGKINTLSTLIFDKTPRLTVPSGYDAKEVSTQHVLVIQSGI